MLVWGSLRLAQTITKHAYLVEARKLKASSTLDKSHTQTPPKQRESGEIQLIPQVSLTLIAFSINFPTTNHIAETQSVVATQEILAQ